jgi:D-alanyl-D-alanine-carboxypeptidase/D-alanyl-D-alanine-endopeptidase
MFAEIDAAAAAFAGEHALPGLVVGIVDGGKLVHVTTLGLADREAGGRSGGTPPSASPR